MTEQVQTEDKPNPYNAKKDWHEKDKPFSSSENLYFEEPSEKNKLFTTSDITEAEDNVNTEELEATKDKPYSKPDYKKRYDDLKRHYDRKLNEFKAREQELQTQVVTPEYKTPKTEEELNKFKEQYPDVYEVVETVAHLQSDAKAKVLEERLSKLQEREMQISRAEAEKRLMERHPDFNEIRDNDDFHNWANNQPESIKSWIYSNADDADLASRALDLFKRDMGISLPQEDKSSSTTESAADMVSTKTTTVEPKQEKVWSEKEIAAMSVAEFDKYEEEISNAMQEGRIVK
tara:strand:+ start:964 stop:1833 length:870 start_codon:yes stop_codon:yes gene_type:complete